MAITSAIVLLAVIWFMTLFVVLPINFESQGDAGKIVPGTPASAPSDMKMAKKLRLVSIIAVVIWVPLVVIISTGMITVDDFDLFSKFGPQPRG